MGLSVDNSFVDPLGNPLGLSRSGANAGNEERTFVDFISGSGSYQIPAGFNFMIVHAVGAGGGGGCSSDSSSGQSRGGGGGAYAGTIVIQLNGRRPTIEYSAGVAGVGAVYNVASTDGGDTSARVLGLALLAGGGKGGGSLFNAGGTGGVAQLGQVMFNGGDAGSTAGYTSAATGGGGAAGRMSAGGSSGVPTSNGAFPGTITNSSSGGQSHGSSYSGAGGGGIYAIALASNPPYIGTPALRPSGGGAFRLWGQDGQGWATWRGGNGGNWGGGGGGGRYSSQGYSGGAGGHGGVRIELW